MFFFPSTELGNLIQSDVCHVFFICTMENNRLGIVEDCIAYI